MTPVAHPRAYIINWQDLSRWDLKSARAAAYRATHPSFRPLGDFIVEATEMVHAARKPIHEWPVYGVNNREGVFFSHAQLGSEFNAPYKRIRENWFFHNPTRANVGSLGRVPRVPPDALTSPEYQVWRIKHGLISDFLEILIRLPFFLDLIECHRVGAVKERLFVENLCEIPIPVLDEPSQRTLVALWRKSQDEVAAARNRMQTHQAAIDAKFRADVGLPIAQQSRPAKAFAVWWKDVDRWGVQMVALNARVRGRPQFPELRLSELCAIGSGGTPSRQRPEYFGGSIPWVKTTEVQNDIILSTEETLTNLGLQQSSAKVYPKDSLIVAMYGQGATRGRTAKLGIDAATNQACAVMFNFSPRIVTDYLWYFLMSQYDALRAMASGNNQPNLNSKMIADLRVPVPSLDEQRRIVDRVASGRSEIARERASADDLQHDISAKIEGMVLGTQAISLD